LGDTLQSTLLQDMALTIAGRSKEGLNPIVKSFLSHKLTAFFQLVTSWTHAAADVHRTVPEHSLCWAQAAAFLDLALDGVTQWRQEFGDDQSKFDSDLVLLCAAAVRYISAWARYLSTNPPENEGILMRVW